MPFISETVETLFDLKSVLRAIGNEHYTKPRNILQSNTIGKHVRHVVEFYECFVAGNELGTINYDSRTRNMLLKNSVEFAVEKIRFIQNNIKSIVYKELTLEGIEPKAYFLSTNTNRELLYNLEHTLHHCAIIRFVILAESIPVELSKNFGYAYSTLSVKNEASCVY